MARTPPIERPGQVGRTSSIGRTGEVSIGQLVVGSGIVMLVLQLLLRAWQLYPSWFYTDDYRLLDDATGTPFSLDYLLAPYDSQFMPLGRALAWVVAQSGHVNWTLTATLTLGLQLLASAACLWMLATLFGARPAILLPLGLYLTSALSVPGTMWWAASLNQLPLQAVLFAATAAWVRYLRSTGLGWLGLTLLILGVGMLSYVKTLLVVGVLAFIVLAYFSTGGPRARVVGAVRRYWPAAVAAGVLSGGFAAYYLLEVPSVFAGPTVQVAIDLANTMIGTAFPSGLLGGPWRWDDANPPAAVADPPAAMVHLTWVAIALVVAVVYLRRRRSLRAWAMLAGYLVAAYVLLLVSRAPFTGGYGGLEYRYVTDVAAAAVLAVALATMPLLGAVESSEARDEPLLTVAPRPVVIGCLTAVVCASGVVSTVRYSSVWHHDHPGASFTQRAMSGLKGQGIVYLADQVVPIEVVPVVSAPLNQTSRLLPLLVDNVRFATVASDLVILEDDGTPMRAEVDPVISSLPGPTPNCGWAVRRGHLTIPLDDPVYDYDWWIQIDYLASADDLMTVRTGAAVTEIPISRGLHTVFLQSDTDFRSVDLGGLQPGTTVCVDSIEIGTLEPAGAL